MSNVNIETMKVAAEGFIVPNKAWTIKSCVVLMDSLRHAMQRFCEANDLEFSEDMRMVQMWFCSEELSCDNMQDHYFQVTGSDGTKWYGRLPMDSIPAELLNGHKEGEIISLMYPVELSSRAGGKKKEMILDIELKLKQLGYRYRNFGPFEECLKAVM